MKAYYLQHRNHLHLELMRDTVEPPQKTNSLLCGATDLLSIPNHIKRFIILSRNLELQTLMKLYHYRKAVLHRKEREKTRHLYHLVLKIIHGKYTEVQESMSVKKSFNK